jgi:peptidyl-prolyl cis-trans isomerase-like protein 2
MKSFFKLHFYKTDEGTFQCPVTFKDFTNNSEIVAIRTSGNVFSKQVRNFEARDK